MFNLNRALLARTLTVRQRALCIAALGVILIAGAFLRIHNVERRTLDHPEVYAPGIDLPWNLSNPNPRFTLWQTLAGTIAGEPHPPGYYIVMLGWTKWFGSSILSLRLPSVLFGIASILLIYILATHTEDTLTGLLSAAMLAANGLHVYWSQTARMYSMACFLGLLSTVILVFIIKNAGPKWIYRVLYFIVTIAGLAAHVYVWAVFATQAMWVLARSLRKHSSLPSLLRLQIWTCMAASPLVAIAAFQTGAATRPSTLAPLEGLVRFLRFGALFENEAFAISAASLNIVASILALLAALVLFASALLSKKEDQPAGRQEVEEDFKGLGPRGFPVSLAFGVLMALNIYAFAYVANTLRPTRSTKLLMATSLLPIALPFIEFLLGRYWKRLRELWLISGNKAMLPVSFRSLNLFLAVLPVSIVAGVSLFNPIFIERGTLVFAPYLLIVLGSGLASLIHRDRRWLSIVLILAMIHSLSVFHYNSKASNPDYKLLAERWVERIKDSDLIFVHGRGHRVDWLVAPIFYYLNAKKYRFVGSEFAREIYTHPGSRVWVLSFHSVPTEKEVTDALAGYWVQDRVDALNISAKLYVAIAPPPGTSVAEKTAIY